MTAAPRNPYSLAIVTPASLFRLYSTSAEWVVPWGEPLAASQAARQVRYVQRPQDSMTSGGTLARADLGTFDERWNSCADAAACCAGGRG